MQEHERCRQEKHNGTSSDAHHFAGMQAPRFDGLSSTGTGADDRPPRPPPLPPPLRSSSPPPRTASAPPGSPPSGHPARDLGGAASVTPASAGINLLFPGGLVCSHPGSPADRVPGPPPGPCPLQPWFYCTAIPRPPQSWNTR